MRWYTRAGALPCAGEAAIRRTFLVATVAALVAGLLGGLIGARFASRLGGSAPSTPAPPNAQAQIRAAVDATLPSVVLILASSETSDAIGSGVMVSPAGHVLTAAHVVRGASQLSVMLSNGEERPARLIADDSPFTDVAVLQIPPQGIRSLPLGSSAALKAGDIVLAIAGGTGQFGSGNAVAMGVVSGTGKTLPRSGVTFEDMIQTDAAINSGDSGGALVNLRGEVVGVLTTVIRTGPGGAEVRDVGFVQSSDSIRPVVAGVIANGGFPRPRIGIERPDEEHIEITPDIAQQRQLPVPEGALVVAPAANSPAAKAGVVPGDIVVGVNGAQVTFEVPFVNLLKHLPRGVRVDLAILRDGGPVTVPVVPAE